MTLPKPAFYEALKKLDYTAALRHAAAARDAGVFDKHMLGKLIAAGPMIKDRRIGRRVVAGAYDHLSQGKSSSNQLALTPHLCTDLIGAFSKLGDIDSARKVLDRARTEQLVNIKIFNSYLRACAGHCRSALRALSRNVQSTNEQAAYVARPIESTAGLAVAAAASVVAACTDSSTPPTNSPPDDNSSGQISSKISNAAKRGLLAYEELINDGLQPDAITVALMVELNGWIGRLNEAEALLSRHADVADTFAHNVLLGTASRARDALLAVEVLQRMALRGPPPDLISYNTTLQAIATSKNHSASLDHVAMAQDIRKQMAAHGIAEDGATRTSLATLFGDSPFAEPLAAEHAQHAAVERAEKDAEAKRAKLAQGVDQEPSNAGEDTPAMPGSLTTELRGLTRPSVAAVLSQQLNATAGSVAKNEALPTSWIIQGNQPGQGCQQGQGRGQGGRGGSRGRGSGSPKSVSTTLRTARDFLQAHGIRFKQNLQDGKLTVQSADLEQAANDAHAAFMRQRVLKGSLLRWGFFVSTLAAFALMPRMAAISRGN